MHSTETLGPRLQANRNGDELCTACCYANRFESRAIRTVKTKQCPCTSSQVTADKSWPNEAHKAYRSVPTTMDWRRSFTTGWWGSVRIPLQTCSLQFHAKLEKAISRDSERVYRSRNKVKLTLQKATKAQRGSRGIAVSLTSVLDGVGGQRHAPADLPPGKPGTHCIGGWVGPRAGLDGCGKSRPHRDSIPGPSSP